MYDGSGEWRKHFLNLSKRRHELYGDQRFPYVSDGHVFSLYAGASRGALLASVYTCRGKKTQR